MTIVINRFTLPPGEWDPSTINFVKQGASAIMVLVDQNGNSVEVVAKDSRITSIGESVIQATTAAAARSAIGAGTSNLTIGTTASTAKAGNWTPTWAEVTDKPSSFTPAAHTHTASQISDSTATGRSVLTAADAAAVRTAIGAGTGNSNLTIGTTASTAKAGNYTPTSAEITAALGFTPYSAANPAGYLTASTGVTSSGNQTIGGEKQFSSLLRANAGLNVTGDIYASGSISGLSDIREKFDIAPVRSVLWRVLQLSAVGYRWKTSGNYDEGFIAQDVKVLFPAAVKEVQMEIDRGDGVTEPCTRLTIDYSRMVIYLAEGLKELATLTAVALLALSAAVFFK